MPSDSSCVASFVPVLPEGNFQNWSWAVKAYLAPNDHVHVIKRTRGSGGKLHNPVAPTDVKELEVWIRSERMVIGIIAGSVIRISLALLHKYEDKSAWSLWCAIEALHEQKDASLCHSAWMGLLGIRKAEYETNCKYLGRLSNARARVDRVTPNDLSADGVTPVSHPLAGLFSRRSSVGRLVFSA